MSINYSVAYNGCRFSNWKSPVWRMLKNSTVPQIFCLDSFWMETLEDVSCDWHMFVSFSFYFYPIHPNVQANCQYSQLLFPISAPSRTYECNHLLTTTHTYEHAHRGNATYVERRCCIFSRFGFPLLFSLCLSLSEFLVPYLTTHLCVSFRNGKFTRFWRAIQEEKTSNSRELRNEMYVFWKIKVKAKYIDFFASFVSYSIA